MKSKFQKQEEAKKRQAKFDALTLDEKLASLPAKGAKKQWGKLNGKLVAQQLEKLADR